MKYMWIKVCITIVGILCVQSFLVRYVPPPYAPVVSKAEGIMRENPDVLLFGDSTIWVMHPNDLDKSSITTMLGTLMPSSRIRDVTGPAYDAEMYLEYVRYILRTNTKEPVMIFPINIRSFSPQWDARPAFQYVDEKVSLRYADTVIAPYLRFLFAFGAVNRTPISLEQFYSTPVYDGKNAKGTVKDYEQIKDMPYSDQNMRNLLVYFYMFELTSEHRKLKALERLADLLRERRVRAIFYLTPVDWETGVSFLGERFRQQIASNTKIVLDILERKGFPVMDLTLQVSQKDFGWKDAEFIYINEHLNQTGRMYIAKQLERALREQFFLPQKK